MNAPFHHTAHDLTVARVTTPIRKPNLRLQALLRAERPLTADEWAYVEQCERDAA